MRQEIQNGTTSVVRELADEQGLSLVDAQALADEIAAEKGPATAPTFGNVSQAIAAGTLQSPMQQRQLPPGQTPAAPGPNAAQGAPDAQQGPPAVPPKA